MAAVFWGLLAAVLWAASSLGFARAARNLSAGSVVAWTMLVGLVVDLAAIAATRTAAPTGLDTWAWLWAAGVANVIGIGSFVAAVKVGRVGVLAPIASTEGAVAALLAVLAGERLGVLSVGLLALIVGGVVVTTRGESRSAESARPLVAAGLALCAAAANGASIFMVGHVTSSVPAVWAVLPPRVVGAVCVALPTVLRGRLERPGIALPAILVSGVCDLTGFIAYAKGASSSIAIAAVLASMFSAFAALGAFLLHGERLTRRQVLGVGCIVAGVAALAAVTAIH